MFRELRRVQIFVVVTYRLDDAAVERKLAGVRSAATRAGAATVRLTGLARNETRHLLQRSAAARGARVAPEIFAQIEDLAEGNPLFAEELLAVALEHGRLRVDRDVPLTARAVAAERLAAFERARARRCSCTRRSSGARSKRRSSPRSRNARSRTSRRCCSARSRAACSKRTAPTATASGTSWCGACSPTS